jgi:hypothetical protein
LSCGMLVWAAATLGSARATAVLRTQRATAVVHVIVESSVE